MRHIEHYYTDGTEPTILRRPYVPMGCDQQGRYPERVEPDEHAPAPAEAATDLGVEDPQPPEHDMFMVVLTDVAISATILVLIHALLLWVIYG